METIEQPLWTPTGFADVCLAARSIVWRFYDERVKLEAGPAASLRPLWKLSAAWRIANDVTRVQNL